MYDCVCQCVFFLYLCLYVCMYVCQEKSIVYVCFFQRVRVFFSDCLLPVLLLVSLSVFFFLSLSLSLSQRVFVLFVSLSLFPISILFYSVLLLYLSIVSILPCLFFSVVCFSFYLFSTVCLSVCTYVSNIRIFKVTPQP